MIILFYPYYFQNIIVILSSSLEPLHLLPSSSFPLHPVHLFLILDIDNFVHKRWLGITSIWYCIFVKHKYLHLHCLLHLFIFFTFSTYYIIKQLLTIGALDMMWCRPENTNVDLGFASVNIGILRSTSRFASVNIGILWSTSHHVQCPNSQ